MNYWLECIKEAFEDCGIEATDEQIEVVADWVEGAHENYGLATGRDCIPNPIKLENERLKTELEKERNKRVCRECNGTGIFVMSGPIRSSISECSKCRGKGWLL